MKIALTPRQMKELFKGKPILHEVFVYFLELAEECLEKEATYGKTLFVTRIQSTPEEEEAIRRQIAPKTTSGIHMANPPRAIDVSLGPFSLSTANKIRRRVNNRFSYDPTRPKLQIIPPLSHGTGPHFHIQVHPNTRRR